MKGWYIPARPDLTNKESTARHASWWRFVSECLTQRFDTRWARSPEQSLQLHAGEWTVPTQLLVRARGARNQMANFLHGVSVLDVNLEPPAGDDVTEFRGLRLYTPEAGLIAASAQFFSNRPTEAPTVLATQRDASAILGRLLEGGHSVIAGRIAGAFRNIGRDREAEAIVSAMRAAGYDVREKDPFDARLAHAACRREPSPYVHRIRHLWEAMRGEIANRFPQPLGRPNDMETYLQALDEIYVTDAYHLLSIEGYTVSADLIERVRRGDWKPQDNDTDKKHKDAIAARGYWQAFNAVKACLRRGLDGQSPGLVADQDHGVWRQELFAPSVAVGLVKAANLGGYRKSPACVRRSRHVPLNPGAVRDAIRTFFELLAEETEPAVRIVLGHFI